MREHDTELPEIAKPMDFPVYKVMAMLQVRCTKKVQDVLGLRQTDLSGIKETDSILGN